MAVKKRVLSPLQRIFGEDFNFPLFLNIFRRSLPWIIFFIVISLGAVVLYLRYTPATYESTSKLMFHESEATAAIEFIQSRGDKVFSEIELIRSDEVIQRALSILPMQVSYYETGKVLTDEMYNNTPFEVIFSVNDSGLYNQVFPMVVNNDGTYTIDNPHAGVQPVKRTLGEAYETPLFDFVVKLADRYDGDHRSLLNRDFSFIVNSRSTLVREIQSGLGVYITNPRAGIISITMRHRKPGKAADIANALAEVYIEYDRERQKKSTDNILALLKRHIDTISKELLAHENIIKEFRLGQRLINPETEQDFLFKQISALEDERAMLNEELNSILWIEHYVTEGGSLSALSVDVVQSAYQGYMAYINDLQRLESERTLLLLDVGSEHIKVKYYDERIRESKRNLLDNLDNAKRKLQFQLDNNSRRIKEIESQFQGLPEVEAEYFRLSRESESKQKFYLQMKERQTEYEIIRAGIVANFIILDRAKGGLLIAPKKRRIQLVGLFAGFALGFGLVVLRYLTQNKILSVQDVEDNSDIPLIGVIPRVRRRHDVSGVMVLSSTRSTVSEAFRTVRTNMEFVSSGPGPKLIAVTSTVSGEGKTFVSVSMAGVISLTGKRVVIIDLDMRKPRVHRAFGIENLKGMSTVLIGRHTIDEAVVNSKYDFLDVIPSGPVPPNSAELIISRKLKDVLEELKSRYDVVVIDTPPVGVVADALELLKVVDIPVYVFRSEYSNRDFINFPNKLYEDKRVPQLTLVLNDVKAANLRYGKYGYTYSYGYGEESQHRKLFSLRRLRRKLKL